ncbi:MAG: hypothetical protein K2J39_04330 [Ruminococcus sp.]|nr:hypothetical protein [Ruminococcus sp.]
MSNQSNDISVNGLSDTTVHGKKGSCISVNSDAVTYKEIPSGMSEIADLDYWYFS